MTTVFSDAFCLARDYPLQRRAPQRVAESRPKRTFPFTERHLHCVWYDPSLRPHSLRSATGATIVVENPGRWNLEAGPDFLNAVLRIGPEQRRVVGDIEVHIHAADWRHHGHADDPRYAHIIAHITYFPGASEIDSLPPNTLELALKTPLEEHPTFFFEDIDISAYPHAMLSREATPCAHALRDWSPADLCHLLDTAGHERLRRKTHRLAERMRTLDASQVLYETCMAALGYKHNSLPFRRLAHTLPVKVLREHANMETAYVLLVGIAGLIPQHIDNLWDMETRTWIRHLWDTWWKHRAHWADRLLPASLWVDNHLRPQNHPLRRIAAAATLFGGPTDLADDIIALDRSRPESWYAAVRARLGNPSGPAYWTQRLSLGSRPRNDIRLLGDKRIAAITTNVIIPFLAATGQDVAPLLNRIPKESDNASLRHTAFVLFGRDHSPRLYNTGLRQQGLLQIFQDFCLNAHTNCIDCPLVTAIRESTAPITG